MAFLRAASIGVYGRVTDLSGRPLTKTRIVLDGRGDIRVNDKDARDDIQLCGGERGYISVTVNAIFQLYGKI